MCSYSIPDLLAACARREGPAWELLLAEFGPWLAAAIRRQLGESGRAGTDEERAELLQELWCRLLQCDGRMLRAFRGTTHAEAGAYLAAIARSITVDHVRWCRARKRSGAMVGLGAADPIDSAPGPEAMLLGRERVRTAKRRLRELLGPKASRRSRTTAELALFGGLTSREIASRSRGATSVGAVDSLLYRVRRRLAENGLRPVRR